MPTIAFIGAGNMAEAIARGLLKTAVYQPSEIRASDPNADRQKLFTSELGTVCSADSVQAATGADVIVLAVKPWIVGEALAAIKDAMSKDALVISIAAGISAKFIESGLTTPARPKPRIVRVMPNTPMLVGKGMSAVSAGTHSTEHDVIAAERIFSAGGKTVRVPESLMDGVTGVSGSGPAYIFYLTECMAAAGVAVGFTEQQAAQLARQTVIGAAALLEESKDPPQELRRKVTTPKGTTQAAIETMEAADFAGIMKRGVEAAARRAKELGK